MKTYNITQLSDRSIYSTSDAIRACGLDWEVDHADLTARPYFINPEGERQYVQRDVPNHMAVHRTDNAKLLGSAIVGNNFGILQNTEAFMGFDGILRDQKAQFISGGWYHNGASAFLQCRLPHQEKLRNGDQLERYLLIAQGHTGLQALTMRFTHIRPVCSNTLMAALRDSYHSFSLRHTSTIKDRMDEAVGYMQVGLKHLEKAERRFHQMADIHLSEKEQINFLKLAYEQTGKKFTDDLKNFSKWKHIEPIFHDARGKRYSQGTLWHPFNVVTEFEDHASLVKKEKGSPSSLVLTDSDKRGVRQWRSLWGKGTVDRKVKAFQLAEKVIDGRIDLNTGQPRSVPTRGGLVGLFTGGK